MQGAPWASIWKTAAPVEHHARIILAPVGGDGKDHDWYFIVTPDGDYYMEDYGSTDAMRDHPQLQNWDWTWRRKLFFRGSVDE